ncbi:MAG: hypothetical protein E6K65_13415 [Nitrospirae bacterium]|nr:MAG: hypothetical protein E6K65_13415 [Nitrospirota bacterium]
MLNNTSLTATRTFATSTFVPGIDGSIIALIGRNVLDLSHDTSSTNPNAITETIGGSLNPAIVLLQDRALAVLNGSSIAPDSTSNPKISLLTILDSQVTGPTAPPDLLPGDTAPGGSVPAGKSRADIPALIEVIGSSTAPSTTISDSAVVVRSELDQALLAASAPLVTVIQGSMTTTSDFIKVDGVNAKLMANVPNDQLVLKALVQLLNSTANITGHLINVTNGATASVTGNLLALGGNSTLNLAGALAAVGVGSSFSLNSGSLVAFGTGINTLNITNTSGICAGCSLTTTIPNLAGVPVLMHPNATVTVGSGFLPFAGQGTFAGGNTVNTINITPGAAVLQVAAGGKLTLRP